MEETIRICNLKQACMYIKNGVKPIDMDYTDRIVFVFNVAETKEVWEKWRRYELR